MAIRLSRRGMLVGLLASASTALLPVSPLPIASARDAAAATMSANAVASVESALRGNFGTAQAQAALSGDAAAVKLVELLYLKDHWKDAGHARIVEFLTHAKNWPLSETLSRHAEDALFHDRGSSRVAISYFNDRKPTTAFGKLALARALVATGNATAAQTLLRDAWSSADIDAADEKLVLSELGASLTASDHRKRLWSMILAQESNAALRAGKRVGGEYEQAAKVAQLLLRFISGADKKYDALPAGMREQPAMKYALARFYRKAEKFAKARSILASMPHDAASMVDAEAIWTERRIIARRSIGRNEKNTWATAYKIASRHGLKSGNAAVEAEFLSGWIALRFLNDTAAAMKHFQTLAKIAPSRTEKARGTYWIGRTQLANGDKAGAYDSFREAAKYSTVFYGQMAREHIGLGSIPEDISSGKASANAAARIENDEVVRAFRLMERAGGKDKLGLFVWSLANRFSTVDELNAVAAIVHKSGGVSMALRMAKAAGQNGVDIDAWAYPLRGLPEWRQVGRPVEKSLVFALSRQESEFNPIAGSVAGAQGLMQLMPGTARLVAKQNRMSFDVRRLKSDPVYNVQLGAAHLADLVADYNGSYVLTLVAYNAGPRRAVEWVRDYGDPRSGKVDPIDWVESIPFNETRQYVQKVLQNVHIYRSRLAPDSVKPMTADLSRGAPSKINVAAND